MNNEFGLNESKLDTEASYQNIRDQEINNLLMKYDAINSSFYESNEEDLLSQLKRFENTETVKDVIQEIETKIRINQVYIDSENQIKNELKGANNEEEKGINPEENKQQMKLATYNKYTDKEEESDYPRMTVKYFNKLLTDNGKLYYRTYELNDILYLHFKGFRKLENLDLFKNIKVLYLEGNCIKKIEGLETLTQITSLYLHENVIEKIEGLETLKNLYNLNLADNCITKIEGLSKLPNLCNVILSRNKIGQNGLSDLSGLLEMEPSVMVVNLENNKISDENVLEEIFVKMPLIRVIYLQGNECLRKIASYRKNFIAKLKELRYLDDRPVFEDERRFAEAFGRGGLEEERKERALYKKEKEEKDLKRIQDFQDMVENWKGENGNNKESEKEKEQERARKKEEERQKLLEKCKSKLKKKENEIFAESDLITDSNETSNQANNEKIAESLGIIKDAHLDDLPDLETAKNLKESGYMEYMLEKTSEPENIVPANNKEEVVFAKRILIEEGNVETSETKVVEEIINTHDDKSKKQETDFNELD